MQLNEHDTRTLACLLCDYAGIENLSLAPDEIELVIRIAVAAKFPTDSIERLWRIHALSKAEYLET